MIDEDDIFPSGCFDDSTGNEVGSRVTADGSFSAENGEKADCEAALDSVTGIIGTPNIFFTPGAFSTEVFTKRNPYKDKKSTSI